VPLVVTVTVATVGLAAWVWSQRKDEEDEAAEHEPGLDYDNADYGDNPAYGASTDDRPPPSQQRPGEDSFGTSQPQGEPTGSTWGAQMSGALRRTPSPRQFLDSASKTVAAGVGAAGAAVGKALASIREEDKAAYADHERWSEEADAKKDVAPGTQSKDAGKRRRTVAVIVSADTHIDDIDEDGYHEHAVRLLLFLNHLSATVLRHLTVHLEPHPTPQ
jgi:hypothetical protein